MVLQVMEERLLLRTRRGPKGALGVANADRGRTVRTVSRYCMHLGPLRDIDWASAA